MPLLKKYGVKVSSLGSPLGKVFINDEIALKTDMEKCKRLLDVAGVLETRYVRIFSYYIPEGSSHNEWKNAVEDRLASIIELFEKQGLVAIHENEKDIFGDTAEHCLTLFRDLKSENFRAVFDFANYVQVGDNTLEAYNFLKDYIEYIHIKDAVAGNKDNVVCGTGDGNIKELLDKAINKDGYNGFLTLEPHLVLFDTLAQLELKSAKDVIKKNLASNGFEGFSMQLEALKKILEEIQ